MIAVILVIALGFGSKHWMSTSVTSSDAESGEPWSSYTGISMKSFPHYLIPPEATEPPVDSDDGGGTTEGD